MQEQEPTTQPARSWRKWEQYVMFYGHSFDTVSGRLLEYYPSIPDITITVKWPYWYDLFMLFAA